MGMPGAGGSVFRTGGNVYYVQAFTGDDENTGRNPAQALATVTQALTLCTDDQDDYIIVLDDWQETVPVDITHTRVHIIGVSTNPSSPYVAMNASDDNPIFTVTASANNCEIAGFSFGGGNTHAGIENQGGTPMNLHIHHCAFGHSFAGNTPQDGIRVELNATQLCIEDCIFYGNGGGAIGTLTRDGFRFAGAGAALGGMIRNNIFLGCAGVAINLVSNADGMVITGNMIACDADTQGSGITIAATCTGCMVMDNRATFGDITAAMANNPYLDSAAANGNHWSGNMKGNAFIDPA
jgi:type II secretory pathway pseudopilin PulG